MEALSQRAVRNSKNDGSKAMQQRGGARLGFGLAAFALIHLAGCACTDGFCKKDEPKPSSTVSQIAATWNPEVVHVPDVMHGGAPLTGLAGRIYLFGQELGTPTLGDGALVVDLFDLTKGPLDPKAAPLEEWR